MVQQARAYAIALHITTLVVALFAIMPCNAQVAVDGVVTDFEFTTLDSCPGREFITPVAASADLAVLASLENPDTGVLGRVFVIRRGVLGSWSLEATLQAEDGLLGDRFGAAVAVSGNTVAVGAPDASQSQGAIYVFCLEGSVWFQQQRLVADDLTSARNLGGSLALSGNVILAGASYDSGAAPLSGAAYAFRRSGASWAQEAKLTPSDPQEGASFGFSVALEGQLAAIGAVEDSEQAEKAGGVYVFTNLGSEWTQTQKLLAADAAHSDYFGWSVAVQSNTILVGAPLDDDMGEDSGAAYVFTPSAGVWSQLAKLLPAQVTQCATFGRIVALSATVGVVGAPAFSPGSGLPGEFYIFGLAEGWLQTSYLTSPSIANATLGSAVAATETSVVACVAISADGGDATRGLQVYGL